MRCLDVLGSERIVVDMDLVTVLTELVYVIQVGASPFVFFLSNFFASLLPFSPCAISL